MRSAKSPIRSTSASRSATERVEAYIREAIYSGVFKARQRVTEKSLAAQIKCSRGPIREAILRLERDGLLETIPRGGTFVPDVSAKSIEVVFRMRGKLEGMCARYMRERMTASMANQLSAILSDMKAAALKGKEAPFFESDLLLHRTIWKFSDCPELAKTLTMVMNSRGFLIGRTFSPMIPLKIRFKRHEDFLNIVLHSPISKVESEIENHYLELHDEIFGSGSVQFMLASL